MTKFIKIIGLVIFILVTGHIFKLNEITKNVNHTLGGKKPSTYIVLRCVVPNESDEGGFMWHLHHVQCLIHLCKIHNKIPIVYYNRGYYYSPKHGENWYHYFFRPITDAKLTKEVFYYGETYGYTLIDTNKLDKSSLPYLYSNTTFQNIIRYMKIDFNWCYNYINLKPEIQTKLDNFKDMYFRDNFVIGIHYRGTDKYPSHNDNEDLKKPIHISYYKVIVNVREYIIKYRLGNVLIFVASDEEPFIDTIKLHFGNVCSYSTSRSVKSTSNVYLDSTKCLEGSTNKVCQKLDEMKNASIHRGNNDIPSYKKGEDAVMDTWLLASCNIFFKSTAGNFSSQPKRINKNLKVIELY